MGDQNEIIELNSSPNVKPRRRHFAATSESDPNRTSPEPTKDANTLLSPRSRSSTTILLTSTPTRSNNGGGGGGDGAIAAGVAAAASSSAAAGRHAKIGHPPPSPRHRTSCGCSEFATLPLWQCSLAEFLATLLFTFFTISATIAAQRAGFAQPRLALAAAQGAAYSVAVFATAPLSGAHLNPALTLAALLTAHISAGRALLYAASQVLGATFGALLVKLAVPANAAAGFFLGGCLLRQTVVDTTTGSISVVGPPNGAALAAEIFFSLAFVASAFALFVAVYAPRAGAAPAVGCGAAGALGRLTLGAVFAGLALALLVLVSGQLLAPGYTSAGMNPARCFGPAVALGGAALWQQQWVFWVGPILAAILFALFYRALFYAAVPTPPPASVPAATTPPPPPPPPSAAQPPKQRKMDVFLHIKATLQNKPGAEEGGGFATGMVHRKLEIAPFSPASSGMDVEGGYGASPPPPATQAEAGLLEAAEASTSTSREGQGQVILEHADLSLRNLMDIIPEDRRHSNHGFPTTIHDDDDDDDRYKL